MSTEFSFEYVFRAPSAETILRAYFDPDHLAAQDIVGELKDRTVTESTEDDNLKICTWSVRAMKSLPVFARPFVDGGRLSFLETMKWRKKDGEIDLTITPQILGGRVQIAAVYNLAQIGEGQVRRRYAGSITANITFVGGKIERAVLDEIKKGMPAMAECTQSWLSRNAT